MGAIRARPFLIGVALAAGDVEQRVSGEALTNLRQQPAAIVFFDRLIVDYRQPHIWLSSSTVGESLFSLAAWH